MKNRWLLQRRSQSWRVKRRIGIHINAVKNPCQLSDYIGRKRCRYSSNNVSYIRTFQWKCIICTGNLGGGPFPGVAIQLLTFLFDTMSTISSTSLYMLQRRPHSQLCWHPDFRPAAIKLPLEKEIQPESTQSLPQIRKTCNAQAAAIAAF